MAAALAHLDAAYGGPLAYLTSACGLTDEELAGVRQRLVAEKGLPTENDRSPR